MLLHQHRHYFIVITALRVPATEGVKLISRFSCCVGCYRCLGMNLPRKSPAAGPVMLTEEMFNVLVVPRFSIVKVVASKVLTGEFAVYVPPCYNSSRTFVSRFIP